MKTKIVGPVRLTEHSLLGLLFQEQPWITRWPPCGPISAERLSDQRCACASLPWVSGPCIDWHKFRACTDWWL